MVSPLQPPGRVAPAGRQQLAGSPRTDWQTPLQHSCGELQVELSPAGLQPQVLGVPPTHNSGNVQTAQMPLLPQASSAVPGAHDPSLAQQVDPRHCAGSAAQPAHEPAIQSGSVGVVHWVLSQHPWHVPAQQTLPLPHGVPSALGTHVPGAPAVPWQVKHAPHAGLQSHDPQSTVFLQLLRTEPHFPAQVTATGCGLHLVFPLPFRRLPRPCLCAFSRRLRRLRPRPPRDQGEHRGHRAGGG
jgi:hypothetical protein